MNDLSEREKSIFWIAIILVIAFVVISLTKIVIGPTVHDVKKLVSKGIATHSYHGHHKAFELIDRLADVVEGHHNV